MACAPIKPKALLAASCLRKVQISLSKPTAVLVGNPSWSVRATVPIHAPQRPVASSFHPPLNGAQSHSKTPRHVTL